MRRALILCLEFRLCRDARLTPLQSAPGELIADYRHTQTKHVPPPLWPPRAQSRKWRRPGTNIAPPAARAAVRRDRAADPLPDCWQGAPRALTATKLRLLAEALRRHEPWLEWAGKRERRGFDVDPVALHIHERVSAQASGVAARADVARPLCRPRAGLPRRRAVLPARRRLGEPADPGRLPAVMSSLARREGLAGKVQMIYIDPPYGIKFASNFQPEVGRRDVKDKEEDLTREPEMVKAYRDTWTLGVHSYLAYLRDRLIVARELWRTAGRSSCRSETRTCTGPNGDGRGVRASEFLSAILVRGRQRPISSELVLRFTTTFCGTPRTHAAKVPAPLSLKRPAKRRKVGTRWSNLRADALTRRWRKKIGANVAVPDVKLVRLVSRDSLTGQRHLFPFAFRAGLFHYPHNRHWKTTGEDCSAPRPSRLRHA